MNDSSDRTTKVRSPTHLRKLARNTNIMVDASPKDMVTREIIHVQTNIRGGLMMLDIAREYNGTLTAVQSGSGLFLYLHIPHDPHRIG